MVLGCGLWYSIDRGRAEALTSTMFFISYFCAKSQSFVDKLASLLFVPTKSNIKNGRQRMDILHTTQTLFGIGTRPIPL
jgi:hypothetical protein